MQLSKALLANLLKAGGDSTVKLPSYDPSNLTPGLVHVGVGNFHRAHHAVYHHKLFEQGLDLDWGIVGATMTPGERSAQKRASLAAQDWLCTVVERDANVVNPYILASMMDHVPTAETAGDYAALLDQLSRPEIRIVSMTVTEGGYFLNPATGTLDTENDSIQHDGANPDTPHTLFGCIVKALKQRREAGVDPFAVMSCDNVPHNGDVVRDVVVGLAAMSDQDLADWIETTVAFPNSMVDRITPATTDAELAFVQTKLGYEDKHPVFCETFTQWVMEDVFAKGGRPAFEKVGCQFVPDVTPYEKMKIRILNGGHATLCYPSALLGVDYVHQAMEHPVIGPFLDTVERTEIIPGVPPVPDTNLEEYWDIIAQRFSNPTVMDQIDRNCYDGASRQPKFIIPPAADCVQDNRPVDGLALVSAMWCRYCQGTAEDGSEIAPNDPIWDRLHKTALAAADDPTQWVGMKDIYGDVGQNPVFVEKFSAALKAVSEEGVEAAMKQYTEKFKQ